MRIKPLKKKVKDNMFSIFAGCVTGIINGLFGGGGGMVVVPVLTKILGYKQEQAHATAILIILPVCIVSAFFYSVFNDLALNIVLVTGIGVIVGGVIGAITLKNIPKKILFVVFYSLMLIAGVKLLF